jgi:hypothetical protein
VPFSSRFALTGSITGDTDSQLLFAVEMKSDNNYDDGHFVGWLMFDLNPTYWHCRLEK